MASRSVRPNQRAPASGAADVDPMDVDNNGYKQIKSRVTRPVWHRYYFADRPGQFNIILYADRFLHQFVVDAWVSSKKNMLF